MGIASFAAGFVSGWLVRSTVESSRDLAVRLAASYEELAHRLRFVVVSEREFLADLWAEAKARVRAKAEGREEAAEEEAVPSRGAMASEPPPPEAAHIDGEVVQ